MGRSSLRFNGRTRQAIVTGKVPPEIAAPQTPSFAIAFARSGLSMTEAETRLGVSERHIQARLGSLHSC